GIRYRNVTGVQSCALPIYSFSTVFGSMLAELGDQEPRLCAITAAMKYGTGLNFFKHAHEDRFFDVGMAEEHAVSFAAGLASQGRTEECRVGDEGGKGREGE